MSFSKLLLLLESGIVLYTTYEGFVLANGGRGSVRGNAAVDRDDGDGGMGRLRNERGLLLRKGEGGEYVRRRDV